MAHTGVGTTQPQAEGRTRVTQETEEKRISSQGKGIWRRGKEERGSGPQCHSMDFIPYHPLEKSRHGDLGLKW